MDELAKEREDLAKADRDLREGAERILRQGRIVDELRRDGHDVREAERTLQLFQDTLRAWSDHRDAIIQRIAMLEAEAGKE